MPRGLSLPRRGAGTIWRMTAALLLLAGLLVGTVTQVPLVEAAPGDPLGTVLVPATSGPIDGRLGTTGFVPSGITLQGEALVVTATGAATIANGGTLYGPDGDNSGVCFNATNACPAPLASAFSLIARVGDGPWVFVGAGPTTLTGTGAVVFAFNDGLYDDNDGGYTATLIFATAVQASGRATYGDTTATLTATVRSGSQPVPAGGQVRFTFRGAVVGTVSTNAQGVATTTVPLPAGTAAGNYAGQVHAEYRGDTGYQASDDTGPLVVARRILWVKPTDRTVGLKQPNPPTTPPANCLASQTPTSACWLQLANDSAFVNGDDWADLNLAQLRFAYSRSGNGPATEKVGAQYRITALGALSSNYDLRYQTGTLRVVAAP